jgi:hypothetical protein
MMFGTLEVKCFVDGWKYGVKGLVELRVSLSFVHIKSWLERLKVKSSLGRWTFDLKFR